MIRNALQRFMYGRYGNDQLNLFLLFSYVALYLLYSITHIVLFYWVSFAAVGQAEDIAKIAHHSVQCSYQSRQSQFTGGKFAHKKTSIFLFRERR